MRLFDLLYGMRQQQFQAPSMSTPTPAYGFQAPGMSTPQPPQQFQPPGMSQPLPPYLSQPTFTPPSMSSPTPPQALGQQGQQRGMQAGMFGRFQSPQHRQAGWMGARAPWSFEP